VIQTEGRIGRGYFGGSMSEAVDKAAEEIAEYAIANFK
jgi:allophanate hydrolase subunit 2